MENSTLQKVSILLSAITTIVVLIATWSIRGAIVDTAALQFGGVENYKLARQLYTNETVVNQQKASLEEALQNVGASAGTTGTPTNNQQPTTAQPANSDGAGTLTPDQLTALRKDAYVVGNENAKITIVEYADPECPYCVMHHQNNTIGGLVEGSDGQINSIYKPVVGVSHAGTERKSLAILCAGQLGGAEGYEGMIKKIYENSTPQTMSPVADIATYAKDLGLDEAKLEACITNGDTKATYNANWSEFGSFTSQPGTPGNLIINNETGEWQLLLGAHPAASFKTIIDGMLGA